MQLSIIRLTPHRRRMASTASSSPTFHILSSSDKLPSLQNRRAQECYLEPPDAACILQSVQNTFSYRQSAHIRTSRATKTKRRLAGRERDRIPANSSVQQKKQKLAACYRKKRPCSHVCVSSKNKMLSIHSLHNAAAAAIRTPSANRVPKR